MACVAPTPPTVTPGATSVAARTTTAAAAPAQSTSAPAAAPTVTPTPAPRQPGQLVVVAASSLANPFQDMASAFLASSATATGVSFNFGSNTQLRLLVGQNVDADVLATDDQAQMDNARQANFVVAADQVFGSNRLVLVVSKSNPKHIAALKDLANAGVRWVTTDPGEPTEPATLALLDRAAADPDYGADFRAKAERTILARIGAPGDAVMTVHDGQADATIVYTSAIDPSVRDQIQQIEIADALSPASNYAIAVTRTGHTAIGQAFVAFVLSPRGQDILKKWGIVAQATGG